MKSLHPVGALSILLRSFQRTDEMFLSIHCYATKVPDLVSLCIQWYVKKTFWKYLFNKTLRFLLYWQAMTDCNNHVWVCGILLAHITLPNGLRAFRKWITEAWKPDASRSDFLFSFINLHRTNISVLLCFCQDFAFIVDRDP